MKQFASIAAQAKRSAFPEKAAGEAAKLTEQAIAALFAEQACEPRKGTLAADMSDDLLQRLGRQARRGGGCADRIARRDMSMTERGHGGLDLLRRKPDLRREILDIDIFSDLAEQSVEQPHDIVPMPQKIVGS
ncbi:MAG: hypothetical protein V4472_27080 [Pseudomonadota bacterium]